VILEVMEIHGLILCEASPLMFSAHAVVHVCLSMMVHMKGCMILYNTQCVALMMMMHLFGPSTHSFPEHPPASY